MPKVVQGVEFRGGIKQIQTTRSAVSSWYRSRFRCVDRWFVNKHELFGGQRRHSLPPLGAGLGDILTRLFGRNHSLFCA